MHMTMKDSLSHLLRERFEGHEAPVDPATWQVIEARLLTAAPATDAVNELFRERFEEHQVDVDPSAWQAISSQLGHGAAAGGGFLSGFGWVAAGVAGVVAAGALVWALRADPADSTRPAVAEHVQETASVKEAAIPAPAVEPASAPEQSSTVAVEEHAATASAQPGNPIPAVVIARSSGNPQRSHAGETLAEPVTEPAIEMVRDSNPELVESIISDLAEQVRKDVSDSQRLPNAAPEQGQPAESQAPAPTTAEEPPVREEVKLYMPNVFTPNGDVQNETYRIEPKTGWLRTLVRVYSMKTNQLVFSSNSLSDEWTGANCEDGYYLVAVELTTMDERVVSKGQVVWLNRNIMN